jgi:hypothetical protein
MRRSGGFPVGWKRPSIGHSVPKKDRTPLVKAVADQELRPDRDLPGGSPYSSCLTIATDISTAPVVPLFARQWMVFLSSGQPLLAQSQWLPRCDGQ